MDQIKDVFRSGFGRNLLHRTMVTLCVAILLCVSTFGHSLAEDESAIVGKVVSSETGGPLAFASLALYETSSASDTTGTLVGGVLSKPDGTFRITVAPGSYMIKVTFVSYNTKKVAGIAVTAGETTPLNIALVPDAIQLETVEVTSYAIENSEASILAHQRKSAAVSDGVSAQQIKKTTDSNAAVTRWTSSSRRLLINSTSDGTGVAMYSIMRYSDETIRRAYTPPISRCRRR